MAKCHTFRKTKPGKPIPVTARELESFMLEHKGKFNSREYDKFERMELIDSPVRDAIHGDLGGSNDFARQNHFLSASFVKRIINYSFALISLKGRTLFVSGSKGIKHKNKS